MDRRRFLLGASALGVTACAQPERELLDEFADATIPLEPGAPRSTTTVAPVESQAPDEPKPDNGLPVDVPDEDLPGLSFVAEAIVPSVGVSATRAIDEPIMEFANPIPSGGPLAFLVEDLADLNRMEVLLPTRPNGSFGWINGSDVRLTRHNYAFEVRLDDLLILFERGLPIFEATVGVARENANTARRLHDRTPPPTPTRLRVRPPTGFRDTARHSPPSPAATDNSGSTAPTIPTRSASTCRPAVSVSTTTTSPISSRRSGYRSGSPSTSSDATETCGASARSAGAPTGTGRTRGCNTENSTKARARMPIGTMASPSPV